MTDEPGSPHEPADPSINKLLYLYQMKENIKEINKR